ncbi:MAG: YceI family protein [Anaerolineae bacterium]|nr:YceI family protein [Anaerolineae bacterium]
MKTISTQEMNNRLVPPAVLKLGLIAVMAALVVGIGLFAYIWLSGGSGSASAPVSAPSLIVGGSTKLFRIQPTESEVRFIINETLVGQPKTVIGSTREVAGDLAIDFNAPQQAMIGQIRINVRTLTTDNEFRNRALRGQILGATQPEFEFASFTPKQLMGLPEKITFGQAFAFQIIGDLTLRGATHEVTFDASVTPISQTLIKGSAKAEVHYTDFGMSIPEAPGVANVSQTVQLEIDLTAAQVEAS